MSIKQQLDRIEKHLNNAAKQAPVTLHINVEYYDAGTNETTAGELYTCTVKPNWKTLVGSALND